MDWDWQKFYDRAYDWIIQTGPKIILAVIVLLIGIWLIRILNRGIKRGMSHRKISPSVRYFLQNLIAIALQLILVMLVLQIVGVQLTFLSAIIAGLTVAVGLALSGTLQNFVSGILILVLKPYRVGDNISTQSQEGTVTAIQLFYTTVLTFDNKTIIIPNGQLSNNVVVNLSREGKRRLDIEFKFGYGVDLAHLKTVIQQSISTSEHILPNPVSRIGVSQVEYDRYTITVNVWIQAHGFYDTKMMLNEKLITDIKQSGIKFPGM